MRTAPSMMGHLSAQLVALFARIAGYVYFLSFSFLSCFMFPSIICVLSYFWYKFFFIIASCKSWWLISLTFLFL
jgi:hypothetical protein